MRRRRHPPHRLAELPVLRRAGRARSPRSRRGSRRSASPPRPSSIRAGLVACTGSRGCKFAASDTKGHALIIADHVEARPAGARRAGERPPHRLPQFLRPALHRRHRADRRQGRRSRRRATPSRATTSWSAAASATSPKIGPEIWKAVKAEDCPARVEALLRAYLARRDGPGRELPGLHRPHRRRGPAATLAEEQPAPEGRRMTRSTSRPPLVLDPRDRARSTPTSAPGCRATSRALLGPAVEGATALAPGDAPAGGPKLADNDDAPWHDPSMPLARPHGHGQGRGPSRRS